MPAGILSMASCGRATTMDRSPLRPEIVRRVWGGGLDATGAASDSLGMKPGKAMVALAGASEFGGGILTATGIAEPLGPFVIAGTMVVASATRQTRPALAERGV
jgi:uncharacterized membrane protein YphA (DoxX/SURF4 family)